MSESTNVHDGYTYYTEPHAQGGRRYAKCTECGREVVPAKPERIPHADECSRSD